MSDFCLFQIREVGCQKISIFERRYFLFLNFICGPKYNTKPSQTSTYLDISYRYTVMDKHQYIVNDIYISTHTYNIKYPRLTPTEYLLVIFVLMRRVESDPSEQSSWQYQDTWRSIVTARTSLHHHVVVVVVVDHHLPSLRRVKRSVVSTGECLVRSEIL